MAPCGGRRLERGGRHGLGPGHGVEVEHVGVAVGLPAAALATEDDEPAQRGVIPDGRVHQRRRPRARRRDLEPLRAAPSSASGAVGAPPRAAGNETARTYLERGHGPGGRDGCVRGTRREGEGGEQESS